MAQTVMQRCATRLEWTAEAAGDQRVPFSVFFHKGPKCNQATFCACEAITERRRWGSRL